MLFFHSKKTKWYIIIGISVLLLCISCLVPALKPSKNRIRQMRSEHHLRTISEWVLAYKKSHDGNPPRKISDLVPDNRPDLLKIFRAPYMFQFWKPEGWSTNKALVDMYSDYALCHNSKLGIIAFEKPGVCPDGVVAVCFTNLSRYTVLTVTKSETGEVKKTASKYQLKVELYKPPDFEKLFVTF